MHEKAAPLLVRLFRFQVLQGIYVNREVTVFVVYDAQRPGPSCNEIVTALQAKRPRWLVEGDGLATFRAGRYDNAPVQVSLNAHSEVREEAQEMADALVSAAVPAPLLSQIRQGSARFEITWNLTRDPDPVPETADVVAEIADIAARLTGGVALINGSRLFAFGAEPFDQLFPV